MYSYNKEGGLEALGSFGGFQCLGGILGFWRQAFKHLEGSQGFRVFLDIWGDPKASDGSQGFGRVPGFWRDFKEYGKIPVFRRDPRILEKFQSF